MAADQNPPQSMGSTNTMFNTEIRYDPLYIKSMPGVIKIAAIILDLLVFICIQSSAFRWHGGGVYFSVVAQLALWWSVATLALYACHVVERYHRLWWRQAELAAGALLALLYLIAATMAVAFGSTAYSAAGFFGYLAMVLYGFEAFERARALRAGELAQGARVHTKQQHVVTPPALP